MEAFLEEFQHLKIQLEAIKSATRNFHNNNVIGEGGFGMVYQGVLSHSKGQCKVAVKRLDRKLGQGDPEFWKEVMMLSRYTHENIISLLGFCNEDGEKILVYEHASRGSLDQHLSRTALTWRQHLKICLTAAKGLCYLHDPNGTQQRVIHRDIKSANILLDENWNAKVADMGLSKIGPANQPHTFIPTNGVGTPGYVDPVYIETSTLSKESDVYSFGVVLFEVLCGRLCLEYNNHRYHFLVQTWRQSYKQKKLDEIIFQDLKQHMDPRSLETFSDIAYRCLQESREGRPKMHQVVEKLEIALRFQDIFEAAEPPTNYEEMFKNVVGRLVYISTDELKMLLSKGILVNGSKTWFVLNNRGEHCEMISASQCFSPIPWYRHILASIPLYKSRFPGFNIKPTYWEFKVHARTQFLSLHTTYTVHLVLGPYSRDLHKGNFGISYTLVGETNLNTSYFLEKREDGWFMVELYQFTNYNGNVEHEITFQCTHNVFVEGIEFRPLEWAENGGLKDEEVNKQTKSYPETYWEQKLPNDYQDIIKWSKDSQQWTTKKELYHVFRKGFRINNGEEWFSLGKNGKKCHMLQARAAFRKSEWSWKSSPKSRFGEVAFYPHGTFKIYCRSKILSPQTKYASYLVYKLEETDPIFERPVVVSYNTLIIEKTPWYIYLLGPTTPNLDQNTQYPLNRPKRKGLPQQRDDGWMEVQLHEFQTGSTYHENDYGEPSIDLLS